LPLRYPIPIDRVSMGWETTSAHISGLGTLRLTLRHREIEFQLTLSLGLKRSHVLVSAGLVYLDGMVASESDNMPLVLAIDRS
jgi:hypothetical protein